MNEAASERSARPWINRTVVGIVLATFFSDFSHEMATAVLPLYLASIGLGPAALGIMEGVADAISGLSKVAGGVLGHHVTRKRPWAALGYLITAVATAAMSLVNGVAALATLRSVAWVGRGYRGPLRDHLLADAVEPTHFGRAYGLERAGDMLGAVAGPVAAAVFIALAFDFRTVILWTLVPGVAAAASMFFLIREKVAAGADPASGFGDTRSDVAAVRSADGSRDDAAAIAGRLETAVSADVAPPTRPRFPRSFWLFLVGVTLFGLGDFSRTFLIWLAAGAFGEGGFQAGGTLSLAVLLYAAHNVVAAVAAYPVGRLGDRMPRMPLLVWGYLLGGLTHALLAVTGSSVAMLLVAIVLSGLYVSVEQTLEKAVAAETLPRELRSLGFGLLAGCNALGDMVSSLYVGLLLQRGRPGLAFGIAAGMAVAGGLWILVLVRRDGSVPRRQDSRGNAERDRAVDG